MSIGTKTRLADALVIAKQIVDDLAPHCKRLKVAGSLRRKRPEVSDIEIVCEPYMAADLFGENVPDVERIRNAAEQWGTIVKGGDRMIQVQTVMGPKLDLFIVHPPANWWVILAIRTGPAPLGQWAVTRMHQFGLRCQDGRVLVKATGEEHPIESEADFFAAARLNCLPPARRDQLEAMRTLEGVVT